MRPQVSRYEAAFKKMARAAGSSDAEVVISKFVSRNETRAALVEERAQVSHPPSSAHPTSAHLTLRCRTSPHPNATRPHPPDRPTHARKPAMHAPFCPGVAECRNTSFM